MRRNIIPKENKPCNMFAFFWIMIKRVTLEDENPIYLEED